MKLSDIPHDLFYNNILNYLILQDFAKLLFLNKYFYVLILSDQFWKSKFISDFGPINNPKITFYYKYYKTNFQIIKNLSNYYDILEFAIKNKFVGLLETILSRVSPNKLNMDIIIKKITNILYPKINFRLNLINQAVLSDNTKILELLTDYLNFCGPNKIIFEQNKPPLFLACQQNKLNSIKFLIKSGSKLNIIYKNWPILVNLAKYNKFQTIKFLLENGYKEYINYSYQNGPTALYIACQNNSYQTLKLLLKNSANIYITYNGFSPLYIAAKFNHHKIINYILNKSNIFLDKIQKINFINNSNCLYTACFNNSMESLKILLDNSANLFTKYKGFNPVAVACLKNNTKTLEYLLNNIPESDKKFLLTPELINRVCYKNLPEIIKLLINHNIDINQIHNNMTPLMVAAKKNSEKIINILLSHPDIKINIQNNIGYTALHFACLYKYINIINILINNSANINIKNNRGNTPLVLLKQKDLFIFQ